MSSAEIDQFLACARVGRLGIMLGEYPYIVPVGYTYSSRKIYIHSCNLGLKMKTIRRQPKVCFEVDETLSDASMYKSVIIFGTAKIINDPDGMIPYLQLFIDKYRLPKDFEEYISSPGRNREQELATVSIIEITPSEITGKKFNRVI